MRRLTRLISSVALVAAPGFAGVQAADALQPYTAEYSIKISVLRGSLQTSLSVDGGLYRASSEIRPLGLARMFTNGQIEEQSYFEIANGTVRPQRYVLSDTLSRDKESLSIEFDWDAGEALGTFNGEPFGAPIDGLLNDRVSIQYALAHDLSNGGIRERYSMFDAERDKALVVRLLEEEEVKVPFGTFRAIPVQHQTPESSRETTLWCAPALGYLPVIIEQRKGDKRVAYAVLKNYSATGLAIPSADNPDTE